MRRLIVLPILALLLANAAGCSCCRAIVECERRKNQWIKDNCCFNHGPRPIVAPVAAPLIQTYPVQPTPTVICPPAPMVIQQAPQPMAVAPPVCAPVTVCPPQQQAPVMVQPQQVICPQQQEYICEPINVCPQQCYDPCEPMWCP